MTDEMFNELDRFDAEAEKWAESANLDYAINIIIHDAVRMRAFIKQTFMEGLYRGARVRVGGR